MFYVTHELVVQRRENHGIYEVRMGKTVSAVDSSASWVDVSRCEIKSSYVFYSMKSYFVYVYIVLINKYYSNIIYNIILL